MERKRSYVVYGCLVFVLCLSAFLFDVIVQNSDIMPHSFDWSALTQLVGRHVSYNELGLVNALWRLVAYGAMGLLGLRLSFKLGFKDILNDDLKRPKIIVAIILAGVIMGVFFTWYDIMIKNEFELFTLKLGFSNLASGILTSLAEGIRYLVLKFEQKKSQYFCDVSKVTDKITVRTIIFSNLFGVGIKTDEKNVLEPVWKEWFKELKIIEESSVCLLGNS